MNRWTPTNPTNEIPSLTKNLTSEMVRSNWAIENGSFVRLRDVTFTYKFFPDNTEIIKNIRVFISASNLFTISGYSGVNPDVSSVDANWNLIPFSRVFTVGVSASF